MSNFIEKLSRLWWGRLSEERLLWDVLSEQCVCPLWVRDDDGFEPLWWEDLSVIHSLQWGDLSVVVEDFVGSCILIL